MDGQSTSNGRHGTEHWANMVVTERPEIVGKHGSDAKYCLRPFSVKHKRPIQSQRY